MCRESTLEHLNYCYVTLRYNTEEKKSGIQWKKKNGPNIKPLNFSDFGEKKGLSWATFIFPPNVSFKTATCGFLLVQADRKYHFIMASTFLSSSPLLLLASPSLLSCVREGRHKTAVWQCAQYDTVQLSIAQYSTMPDVTYVGRLHVHYSKWALHSTTVRRSRGLRRGPRSEFLSTAGDEEVSQESHLPRWRSC